MQSIISLIEDNYQVNYTHTLQVTAIYLLAKVFTSVAKEAVIFYGKLEFINALISYEVIYAHGIKQAFQDAIDDYLKLY